MQSSNNFHSANAQCSTPNTKSSVGQASVSVSTTGEDSTTISLSFNQGSFYVTQADSVIENLQGVIAAIKRAQAWAKAMNEASAKADAR